MAGALRDLLGATGVWMPGGNAAPLIDSGSAVQRDSGLTFLVDVTYAVHDPSDTTGNTTVEWRHGTSGAWLPTTPQPYDRHHSQNPLTGIPTLSPGKTFKYVWRAFDDLPRGVFTDIYLRITFTDPGSVTDHRTVGPVTVDTEEDVAEDPLVRQLARRAAIASTPLDFLGNGLAFPFRRASRDFVSEAGAPLVQSSVRVIFNTRAAVGDLMGDLPWRPDFGCKHWVLRHRNNDETLKAQAHAFTLEALEWEPRCECRGVTIDENQPLERLQARALVGVISKNVDDNQVVLPEFEEAIPIG